MGRAVANQNWVDNCNWICIFNDLHSYCTWYHYLCYCFCCFCLFSWCPLSLYHSHRQPIKLRKSPWNTTFEPQCGVRKASSATMLTISSVDWVPLWRRGPWPTDCEEEEDWAWDWSALEACESFNQENRRTMYPLSTDSYPRIVC